MIKYEEYGDISTHLPIFYTITRAIKPKVILEIGIRGGASTRAFDEALADGEIKCEHHCCDINKGCSKVVDRLMAGGFFHGMSSNSLALIWTKPIDILFIDGDHSYEQVKKDYINFSPFVRKNGFIFFHDTYPGSKKDDPNSCYTVYKILNDLDIEHVTLPYQNGITICRKN